jgi:cob(I)alamin adenosyltransferase
MGKIYTKTGDLGETSLVSGTRLPKSDHRIDLYGEIDELNSRVGFAFSLLPSDPGLDELKRDLQRIQSALFDLGANMACESEARGKFKLPRTEPTLALRLESSMDEMDSKLATLKNFILPGGDPAAAAFHLCRTGARTVERKLVNFSQQTSEELPEHALVFINRLSDYFFVLARHLNRVAGREEITWKSAST